MFDILFPVCCPICLKPVIPKGAKVCTPCLKKLAFIETPYCKMCGRPIKDERNDICKPCGRNVWFDKGRCVFIYHSAINRAVKDVKNNGTREFQDFFGRIASERLKSFICSTEAEALVPVPLYHKKLRTRGYNQAELLALAIGKYSRLPVVNALTKSKETKDQKDLSRREREQNLEDAFKANDKAKGLNSVILVDDVLTTGSTVNACARTLKASGIKKVFFICIAAGYADAG